MKLEVIATNLKDIKVINKSNADRIEFCWDLHQNGLTPSIEEIKEAGEISQIPVNVMLRPTARDYVYTDQEFQQMVKDIELIAETKVAGIVMGILTKENTIDIERMKVLINKAKGKNIVFHKAFDLTDFDKSLDEIKALNIGTILTAGGANINENLEKINNITKQNKVIILAGGGVNFNNIEKVKKVANEIHVGSVVRTKGTWESEIDVNLINKMKEILN